MAAYLVVAHQTSASTELIHKLQQIAAAEADAQFVLLVPATPTKHWEEGDTLDLACRRARESATALHQAGLEVVDGIVGPPDPLRAVQEEYERRPGVYARTIISTLPPGVSRLLRRDLPHQIRRQLGIEVLEVVARPAKRPASYAGAIASSSPAGR